MTERELELLTEAIWWAVKYDDCNPDVGWTGAFNVMKIADQVCKGLSFSVSNEDLQKAVDLVRDFRQ